LFGPRKNRRDATLRNPVPKGSLKTLQTTISRSGPAAMVSYTLIGAIVLLGGLGYAFDQWRGTSPWGLLGGLMLGLVVGFYELAKTIWKS
jgi:F0F1-type ATP synthase assembly protein I